MFNVFIGKNDGSKKGKKYNTNDIINNCPSTLTNKIKRFTVCLGVYKGEFEDSSVTSFNDYKFSLAYAVHFKRKLNQNEVLITSKNSKYGFNKQNCYVVQTKNTFENLKNIINSIEGGTIFTDTDKLILYMHDLYGSCDKYIYKLKQKGFKIYKGIIYVKSI